jgi:hypothetical protein
MMEQNDLIDSSIRKPVTSNVTFNQLSSVGERIRTSPWRSLAGKLSPECVTLS